MGNRQLINPKKPITPLLQFSEKRFQQQAPDAPKNRRIDTTGNRGDLKRVEYCFRDSGETGHPFLEMGGIAPFTVSYLAVSQLDPYIQAVQALFGLLIHSWLVLIEGVLMACSHRGRNRCAIFRE